MSVLVHATGTLHWLALDQHWTIQGRLGVRGNVRLPTPAAALVQLSGFAGSLPCTQCDQRRA